MSHFLDDGEIPHRATYLRRLRAAVQVTHSREGGDDLLTIVPGSICVLRVDAQLAHLPERVRVVSNTGETVCPSQGKLFCVTLESFNPAHLLVEAGAEDVD